MAASAGDHSCRVTWQGTCLLIWSTCTCYATLWPIWGRILHYDQFGAGSWPSLCGMNIRDAPWVLIPLGGSESQWSPEIVFANGVNAPNDWMAWGQGTCTLLWHLFYSRGYPPHLAQISPKTCEHSAYLRPTFYFTVPSVSIQHNELKPWRQAAAAKVISPAQQLHAQEGAVWQNGTFRKHTSSGTGVPGRELSKQI